MKVEILKLYTDGTQSVVATCFLEGGKVVCQGDAGIMQYLNQGIHDSDTGELLYPVNGTRFLSTLKMHFKSGYLMAREIAP
jgi:L-ascorbate metabolism protein UlaG (beta-lactamase superfamily)